MECNVDVKFSDDRSAILLSGSAGDVEAVLQCIRTKYVSAICDDMLKMDLPGEHNATESRQLTIWT